MLCVSVLICVVISILPRLIYLLCKIIFDKDELQKYREDNKIQTSSCLNKNLWRLQNDFSNVQLELVQNKFKWPIFRQFLNLMSAFCWLTSGKLPQITIFSYQQFLNIFSWINFNNLLFQFFLNNDEYAFEKNET